MQNKKTGSSWLTSAALGIFLLTATSAASAAPVAKQADAFVSSIGIHNVPRLDNTTRDLLVNSGIRVLRGNPESQADFDQLKYMTDRGFKAIVAIQPGTSVRPDATFWGKNSSINNNQPFGIVDYVKKIGVQNVVAVEMNNELDNSNGRNFKWHPTDTQNISGDPNSPLHWTKYVRAATAATASALAGDSATQNIPLLGPSLMTSAAYFEAGDLSSWIDYSNIHHYMAGRHPESSGWGSNAYGSIAWTIAQLSAKQNVANPGALAATEGGNATADSALANNQWSVEAHGKYIPRYYLTHFNAGYKWTCIYRVEDFISDINNNSDGERNFGLIKSDGTPKPAYYAVKNLINLVKDPGPEFSPNSVDYTLSGNTADVQSTLLQKRNGEFYLCLWLAKSGWQWRESNITAQNINVPAQSVTLNFNQAISQATSYTNLQNATMTTGATTNNPTSLNLSVTDSVMVVKIVAANPSAFSRRLDFGNSTSPVESGFTRFAHTLYDTATGHGWDSLASTVARDRTSGTNLSRDLSMGNATRQFLMDVPNGTYNIKVYLGDALYARDNVDVYGEGALKLDNVMTAAGEMAARDFTVTVSDGQLTIEFRDDGGSGDWWSVNGLEVSSANNNGTGTGLTGQYFNGTAFNTLVQTRTDAKVDFNWPGSPMSSVNQDNFSVRWTGKIQPRYSQTYTLFTSNDDGVRLWVDGQLILDKWFSGVNNWSATTPVLNANQLYDIVIEYYEGGGGAKMKLEWQSSSQSREVVPQSQLYPVVPNVAGTGLKGQYYNGTSFNTIVQTRTDAQIDFNWPGSPMSSVDENNFSVRWTGQVKPRHSQAYTFFTSNDDGVRLWIDGELLIDKWMSGVNNWSATTPVLNANQLYDIKMEYYEGGGGAKAKLEWQSSSQSREVVPQSQLYPAP